MYKLTKQEKASIIDQHLRTLAFTKFNFELSLVEEQASRNASQDQIDILMNDISYVESKEKALIQKKEETLAEEDEPGDK